MPFLAQFTKLRPSEARHSLPEAWGDLCSPLSISDHEFGPLQADAFSSRRLGRLGEGAGARAGQLQPAPGAEAGVQPARARPSPGQARPPPRAEPSEPPWRPAGLQGGSRRPPGRTHPWRRASRSRAREPGNRARERGNRAPRPPGARGGAGQVGGGRSAGRPAGGGEPAAPDGASPRDGVCPRWGPRPGPAPRTAGLSKDGRARAQCVPIPRCLLHRGPHGGGGGGSGGCC